MRFAKRHTRNGITFEAGDAYTGDVQGGRFLYQRGVLQPDGSPGDDAITSPKPKQQWDVRVDDLPHVNTRDLTIPEVLELVDTKRVTPAEALAQEAAGQNRVTLVRELEQRVSKERLDLV
jgi:hypothetical protein